MGIGHNPPPDCIARFDAEHSDVSPLILTEPTRILANSTSGEDMSPITMLLPIPVPPSIPVFHNFTIT